MSTPCVNVFRNEEENYYVVRYQAAAPEGGSTDFGEPTIVSADEFDSRIAGLVFKGLEMYPDNVHEPKAMDSRSRKKARDFFRRHTLVSVAKASTGQILVNACEHHGVLYGGVAGGETKLGFAPTERDLVKALNEAFRKAT
jgi:hypothetical protein